MNTHKEFLFSALLALSLALAGCSEQPSLGHGRKVVITGSAAIGEELGPRLIAEYQKDHPETVFELNSRMAACGFWALVGDQCDVAAASRLPKADELKQAKERRIELQEHALGAYCVAIIVNATNPLSILTSAKVRDIFTGVITNWNGIGGPDAPIHLAIRDSAYGIGPGFRELAMDNQPYSAGANVASCYAAMIEAVAKDANAVGFASLELIRSPGIRAVSIDGVAPSLATVNDGTYPYARLLRFYTSKGKEASDTLDFIRFVQSAKGQQIIAQSGSIPTF